MAYSMYNNNSSKRGYFYDVRNYGMHPMEMVEYQRGRPTRLPLRTLNRQFKETAIQLNDQTSVLPLTISVQICKVGKQQQQTCLVLSNSDDAAATAEVTEIKTAGGTICVPEASAIRLIMRLRKLAKWKPTASGGLPSAGLGLSFEDIVFKAQVVNLAAAAGSDESQEAPKQFAIKVLAESRSKDPLERKELASVVVPMEPAFLDKLQSALSKLVVTESPLYHTASRQCSDGSKIYLDLIRDATTHYLKISQVTRDFRSIINVPADEVEGLVEVLSTSLKAIKDQKQQQTCLALSNSVDTGGFTAASLMMKVIKDQQPGAEGAPGKSSSAAGKRKRGRNPRRRPGDNRRRRDAADTTAATAGAATSASVEDDAAASGEAKTSGSQSSDGDEKENVAASEAVKPKQQQPDSSEDSLTVESRPVENDDGCNKTTTVE